MSPALSAEGRRLRVRRALPVLADEDLQFRTFTVSVDGRNVRLSFETRDCKRLHIIVTLKQPYSETAVSAPPLSRLCDEVERLIEADRVEVAADSLECWLMFSNASDQSDKRRLSALFRLASLHDIQRAKDPAWLLHLALDTQVEEELRFAAAWSLMASYPDHGAPLLRAPQAKIRFAAAKVAEPFPTDVVTELLCNGAHPAWLRSEAVDLLCGAGVLSPNHPDRERALAALRQVFQRCGGALLASVVEAVTDAKETLPLGALQQRFASVAYVAKPALIRAIALHGADAVDWAMNQLNLQIRPELDVPLYAIVEAFGTARHLATLTALMPVEGVQVAHREAVRAIRSRGVEAPGGLELVAQQESEGGLSEVVDHGGLSEA